MAKLFEHMPRYYQNSTNIKNITEPMNIENETQETLIAAIVNQFVVNTATYALVRYEEQYGLPINPTISLDERRSRIKAKMRSIGVVNTEMLQNIVDAWTNSYIEVIEDYANFTITIKFVSSIGIPANMQDVYDAINAIKPAHLIFLYEFKYRRNEELANFTHDYLSQFTHNTLREGDI